MLNHWDLPIHEADPHAFPLGEDVIEKVVRAAGVEPARALRPYGFSYHFGFRRRR